MPPTFAVPLPQSPRSEVLEWRFPKPHDFLVLTGRSRAAWHTSFMVSSLNLLLDAGLCINNQRPTQIFLTHGHSDHVLLTPAFVKKENPPDIYCPVEMVEALDNFINAKTILNLGGLVRAEDIKDAVKSQSDGEASLGDEPAVLAPQNPTSGPLATHRTHGVSAGQTLELPRTKNWTATVFRCDHNVPCVGYLFSIVSRRLKPEYTSCTGPEIRDLRLSGVEITSTHSTPVFAFLGDTSIETLRAEPPWLQQGIPVVITECSFLHEKHRPQAVKTKHTIWNDLEHVIRKWPQTTFILTHFSLRYSEDTIREFFYSLPSPPPNFVLWIDGTEGREANPHTPHT